MILGRPLRAAPRMGVVMRLPARLVAGGAVISGAARTWSQVTGNEGYRVIWDATSQASASGSITEIEALYDDSADTATDVNSYTITGSGTIYWRVAALVNGYPQEWSSESSFSA